jgi:hypothetical protein
MTNNSSFQVTFFSFLYVFFFASLACRTWINSCSAASQITNLVTRFNPVIRLVVSGGTFSLSHTARLGPTLPFHKKTFWWAFSRPNQLGQVWALGPINPTPRLRVCLENIPLYLSFSFKLAFTLRSNQTGP